MVGKAGARNTADTEERGDVGRKRKKFQQGTAVGPLDYTEKSGTNSTVDVILKNSLNLRICISKYGDYIRM